MKKILLLFCIFAACFLSAKEVIFIPGWWSDHESYNRERAMLQRLFPGYTVRVFHWRANTFDWAAARHRAELFAQNVAAEIKAMPAARQREVVLVGHSLGGRCCVLTSQILNGSRVKIQRVILLGSAVDYDDWRIRFCGDVSLKPALNLYNYNDGILKFAYSNRDRNHAAGQVGVKKFHPNIWNFQVKYESQSWLPTMRGGLFHFTGFYLDQLGGCLSASRPQKRIDHDDIRDYLGGSSMRLPGWLKVPGVGVAEDFCFDWVLYREAGVKTVRVPFVDFRGRIRYYSKNIHYGLFSIADPFGHKWWFWSERDARRRWNEVKNLIGKQLAGR